MNIDDFQNQHPVDRVQVEKRKKRMLEQLAAMETMWGELTFAWAPTKTTQGWVWLRHVWRIHQADGCARYEIARTT